MSKRFKGKTCAYCAEPNISNTGDHVFAREFFTLEGRGNLPQVPACDACNNKKSTLEHYLTAVMPFGARHGNAAKMLNDFVPARLRKNQKLRRELQTGQTFDVIEQDGMFVSAMGLPFNSGKLDQLFQFIARGMAFHHWREPIPRDANVFAGLIHSEGQPIFERYLAMNGNRVRGRLGNGVFEYEGVQSATDPWVTIWKFVAYGGLQLGGDPDAPDQTVNSIWATTSKKNLLTVLEGKPVAADLSATT